MSDWNIAAKSQEERDKVNVDLAASGVAYKERRIHPSSRSRWPDNNLSSTESILWSVYGIIGNVL